jgi:nitroreductase
MDEKETHPFSELIRRRTSTELFDAARSLDEAFIRELIEEAVQAPSSFNIQHWRFIAVRRPDDKRALKDAAFGQRQVEDAAVTFVILGDIRGVERLPEVMDLAVARGAMPEGKADAWVRMAREIYADETAARDEALRSGCLAAMLIMLAAEERGLGSAPLSGFDVDAVRRLFDIDERYVPVMLLAVGHVRERAGVRQPRMPVEAVLAFDRCRFP